MFRGKIFERQKIIVPWLEVFNFGDTSFKPYYFKKKIGLLSILIKELKREGP